MLIFLGFNTLATLPLSEKNKTLRSFITDLFNRDAFRLYRDWNKDNMDKFG